MFRTIPQSYNNSLGSRLQHMSRRQRLTRIAIVP
jgi:phage gp46-like protein